MDTVAVPGADVSPCEFDSVTEAVTLLPVCTFGSVTSPAADGTCTSAPLTLTVACPQSFPLGDPTFHLTSTCA